MRAEDDQTHGEQAADGEEEKDQVSHRERSWSIASPEPEAGPAPPHARVPRGASPTLQAPPPTRRTQEEDTTGMNEVPGHLLTMSRDFTE
jgi:hypothetical protein